MPRPKYTKNWEAKTEKETTQKLIKQVKAEQPPAKEKKGGTKMPVRTIVDYVKDEFQKIEAYEKGITAKKRRLKHLVEGFNKEEMTLLKQVEPEEQEEEEEELEEGGDEIMESKSYEE